MLEIQKEIQNLWHNTVKKSSVLPESKVRELIQKSQDGDLQAKHIIVMGNLKLVMKIAAKINIPEGMEISDLIQAGHIGLMDAIDQFDLSSDYQFSTYAYSKIYFSIKNYTRDIAGIIRIPRHIMDALYCPADKMDQKTNPAFLEPAYLVQKVLSLDHLNQMSDASEIIHSGYDVIASKQEDIAQEISHNIDAEVFWQKLQTKIEEALPVEYQTILYHTYGIGDFPKMTNQKIAQKLCISVEKLKSKKKYAISALYNACLDDPEMQSLVQEYFRN